MVEVIRDHVSFERAGTQADILEIGKTLKMHFSPIKQMILLTFDTTEGTVRYQVPAGDLHSAVNSCFLDPAVVDPPCQDMFGTIESEPGDVQWDNPGETISEE